MVIKSWEQYCEVLHDRSGTERIVSVAKPNPLPQTPTVVFCADGQVVEMLTLSLSASEIRSPPILIGVQSHEETRAQDYLFKENANYFAHEAFFVEELPSWVNAEFDVSISRSTSIVFGFSNGGAFALAVALRHPDRFSAAFSFSPPKLPTLPSVGASDDQIPAIYFAVGTIGGERAIRRNVLRLTKWLRKNNAEVTIVERNENHTLDFWVSEMPIALDWFHTGGRETG